MSSNAEEIIRFHCPKSEGKELLSVQSQSFGHLPGISLQFCTLVQASGQTLFRTGTREGCQNNPFTHVSKQSIHLESIYRGIAKINLCL